MDVQELNDFNQNNINESMMRPIITNELPENLTRSFQPTSNDGTTLQKFYNGKNIFITGGTGIVINKKPISIDR